MDQPYDSSTQLTPNSIKYLRSMAGWIKFVTIFSIVLLSIAIFGLVIAGVASLAYGGAAAILGLFLYLIIMGLLLWLCVVFLRSANAFSRFTKSGQPIDLETGVRAQKSGWIVAGVLYILLLVFVLIVVIALLGFGSGRLF